MVSENEITIIRVQECDNFAIARIKQRGRYLLEEYPICTPSELPRIWQDLSKKSETPLNDLAILVGTYLALQINGDWKILELNASSSNIRNGIAVIEDSSRKSSHPIGNWVKINPNNPVGPVVDILKTLAN